ncbi:class I SAM-dependent methyltransferase [Deinococcus radiophilus]|uniref:class I SAM-dependent methyltransferase n=1 Tax=Deinococcus radiophilus TaxID=32062 RepID=UPI003609FA45
MAALPRTRYRRALEVGCSIGVLTGQLAERTEWMVATDVNRQALKRSRARNAGAANIQFIQGRCLTASPLAPLT